ncbi:bacteriohopanetetrol glucosamine biosynthesis glycosyltransferase HpnI [Anaeromyxobacter oryzae]|uniref:Ceramide glucosyltransferase n=1 Tax=Anaeromyxobacter oryzae TaxID=2918170 RepID=A0ABN6MQN3_9BACT|nr:bacteriohopanetetrol glucosamine biosynthesis glycosyltransferase HpnI [Anaeromyxobacter oryzae]BDG02227.1 ceramide glucosyltransferase [Anaeromyxobacter oryzae]
MILASRALLALTAASWVYWALALLAVRRHVRARVPVPAAPLPPVSILKPVRGVDADARACFESFLRQDYPTFELVFGVADPSDPVLPLLAELRAAHPGVAVQVVVAPAPGPNRKASLLAALTRAARHDVLVSSDSDMRVEPTWLGDVVATLEPDVGLVTCPYRAADPRSLAASLEALYVGVTFLPSAIVAGDLLGMPFGMGSTLALRRRDLRALGGFAALVDYLADDYQLGARVAALGRRVVVARHVVTTVLGPTTVRDGWEREVRWARCTRASQPLGHFGFAMTFSTPLAVLALLATGLAPLGWAAVAGSLAVRWLAAAGIARATGDLAALQALPLLPLRDGLTAAVWAAAAMGRRVVWRGDVFHVDRVGRLRPVPPERTAGPEQA